jgi:hypothetical protein
MPLSTAPSFALDIIASACIDIEPGGTGGVMAAPASAPPGADDGREPSSPTVGLFTLELSMSLCEQPAASADANSSVEARERNSEARRDAREQGLNAGLLAVCIRTSSGDPATVVCGGSPTDA